MTTRAGLLPWSASPAAALPYLRLAKPRIAALSTLSAGAAFSLAAPHSTSGIFPTLAGLFLLAGGCGALNQYQERALDARMPRTCRRPLPAGEMRPRAALLFALSLMLPGLLLLQRGGGGAVAALLGLAAIVWYNGVYTGLKRRTALALFPGALVGAIPPAIGWVGAGGSLADPRLLSLCGLLFLWQLPHFGLLLLAHGEEYARGGLPVLSELLPRRLFARIVNLWLLGAAAAGLLVPLPAAAGWAPRAILAAASLALAVSGRGILSGSAAAAGRVFHATNAYLVLVLVIVLAGAAQPRAAASLDNRSSVAEHRGNSADHSLGRVVLWNSAAR